MLTPFQSSLVPQPACTPFLGSGWRHPDLRYNQNNAKLSSGNQCGSVSWIRNNIFWTACIFQNNADFTKRPLLPPPACTLWNGSGWRHQDPKYNQNNADLSNGNRKAGPIMGPGTIFWNRLYWSEIMLTPTQSRLRLVSIYMEPDGDIQIQGTVKISTDPSNSNRMRFIFFGSGPIPEPHIFCQNNADAFLEPVRPVPIFYGSG